MSKLTVPVNTGDHVQGSENAGVTLVEYGDYQCPYCGAAYPIVKRVQTKLGADLRFVFRNFPLTESHPRALAAAQAAEAAALQGKFWEMHDMLYEHQKTLQDNDLLGFARELGLDLDKFKHDFSAEPVKDRIEQDFSSGIRSGVNGTPTFFINGARHDDSFAYPDLLAALEAQLESEGTSGSESQSSESASKRKMTDAKTKR